MVALVDCRHEALRTQGFVGAGPDMMVQWLQANGATSSAIPDAWQEMLNIIMVGPPTGKTDQWYDWLLFNSYGAEGDHINDMETLFWCNGGLLVPYTGGGSSFNDDFNGDFG